MAGFVSQPVATFTIGFEDDQGFDERPFARMVAQRYKTDHVEFVVNPDAASLVERLVWHHDQPFGDSSALPTYLLSELTRKHVTVALCGDGGDELFAGYERFAAGAALAQFQRFPKYFRDGLFAAARTLPPTALAGRAGSAQRLLARRNPNRCSTHTCRGSVSYPSPGEVRCARRRTAIGRSMITAGYGRSPMVRTLSTGCSC